MKEELQIIGESMILLIIDNRNGDYERREQKIE
jgi:hypothetical protein